IQRIRQGKLKRIFESTERRIMQVSKDAKSPSAYVSSRRAQGQVAELLKRGYLKKDIAREMGYATEALQWARSPRITVRTQVRMDAVYAHLTGRNRQVA